MRVRRSGSVRAVALLVTLASLFFAIDSASGTAASARAVGRGQLLPGTDCPAFPSDDVWNTPVPACRSTRGPVRGSRTWIRGRRSCIRTMGPAVARAHTGSPGRSPRGTRSSCGSTFCTRVRVTGARIRSRPRHRSKVVKTRPAIGTRSWSTPRPVGSTSSTTRGSARQRVDGGLGCDLEPAIESLRPASWTSADAAGLPILPGLVNYDEVRSGHIDHAIRFTAQTTSTRFLWPARHEAGATGDPTTHRWARDSA